MSSHAPSGSTDHHAGVGHVVPLQLLIGVLLVLLVLTFLTVAITWVDLGPFNLAAALGIALVKATLVALYFMHLRWDRPFNGVILLLSLALVMLFVGLSLVDSSQYQPDIIPGDAPGMLQR